MWQPATRIRVLATALRSGLSRFGRLPAPARWALAYAALLALASAVGALTPLGVGNAIFVAGACAVLASLAFIRLGGERTRAGRDITGAPLWTVDPDARRAEIRRGLRIFLLGVALWAALGLAGLLRGAPL